MQKNPKYSVLTERIVLFYHLSLLQTSQRHFGLDLLSISRSEAEHLDTKDNPGPSKKQTPVHHVIATPASILKKTSTKMGSSKKELLRELLALTTPTKREFWRSSPNLYSSGESENGSTGRMNRIKDPNSPCVSNTPTHDTGSLSGIDSLGDSDNDSWDPFSDSEEERGGGISPPYTPPDNEQIYEMLRMLEKEEQ
ncbi:ORF3 [Grizzly bear anellovirus 2]|nr:ORF3 [Grizzly bear anellovirus 2]